MSDEQVTPLDYGISTVDEESLEMDWSSPISQELIDLGYKMVSAEVDETGYFLTVRFENVKLNHVREFRSGKPICKLESYDTWTTLDHDEEKFLCPKCKRIVDEMDSA